MSIEEIKEKYKEWKTVNYSSSSELVMTYIMRDGDTDVYKIGKSVNPYERLQTLRLSNYRLNLIAYGDGCSEKYLHDKYKDFKFEREFFNLNKEQVDSIVSTLINEKQVSEDCPINYIIPTGKYKGKALYSMLDKDSISYISWFVEKGRKESKNGADKSSDTMFKVLNDWVKFLDSSIGNSVKYSAWV